MNLSMLPMGYTFCPTDEQLLEYYLFNKIVGEQVPLIELPVIDLYSQEPSQIWEQCGGVDGQDIYFFTNLKKRKSRIIRKVGSNGDTWSGENKAHQVFSSTTNVLIGSVKRFHYQNSKGKVSSDNDYYSWIMYEYTLDPTIVPKGLVHDSYVLCMIRKRMVKMEETAASKKRQTPCNWPTTRTTTNMRVDDQTHKRIKLDEQVVCLEKEFCIDEVDFKNDFCINTRPFTEEEIQEFVHGNNLELPQPEKDILIIDNQPRLWNQNYVNVESANKCPTTQMESSHQGFSDDDAIYAKEIEMEIERCNNVEPSTIENDSSYDNEWYFRR